MKIIADTIPPWNAPAGCYALELTHQVAARHQSGAHPTLRGLARAAGTKKPGRAGLLISC